eukprot:559608-Pelagomonas_calceolata.AAC.3
MASWRRWRKRRTQWHLVRNMYSPHAPAQRSMSWQAGGGGAKGEHNGIEFESCTPLAHQLSGACHGGLEAVADPHQVAAQHRQCPTLSITSLSSSTTILSAPLRASSCHWSAGISRCGVYVVRWARVKVVWQLRHKFLQFA